MACRFNRHVPEIATDGISWLHQNQDKLDKPSVVSDKPSVVSDKLSGASDKPRMGDKLPELSFFLSEVNRPKCPVSLLEFRQALMAIISACPPFLANTMQTAPMDRSKMNGNRNAKIKINCRRKHMRNDMFPIRLWACLCPWQFHLRRLMP